jgi:hypothetical protein
MATLLKKLKYVEQVHLFDRAGTSTASVLHKLLVNGEAIVLEKQWHDDYKNKNPQYYPLNIEKDHGPDTPNWKDKTWNELWTTYESCRDIKVTTEGRDIVCMITIWNGENFEGFRKNKRWSAKIKLKAKHLSEFKSSIEYRFRSRMLSLYEKEEEAKLEKRVKELSIEVFN